MSNDNALAKLDAAQHALAECKTVMEAKQIGDIAEAARVYLERTNASAETVNRATEIRLLAERQMGEFLRGMPKAKGGAHHHGAGSPKAPITVTHERTVMTVSEMGLTHNQSERAQKLADIPAPEFRGRIEILKASGEKLSTAKVIDAPRRARAVFSMHSWRTQAEVVIRGWLKAVPDESKSDAINFLTELVSKLTTANTHEK